MASTTQPASARPLPQGKISYEEFLQWLDEDTWAEWVNGEVQSMSPVNDEHQMVVTYLSALLTNYASAKRVGIVMGEPFQMKSAPDLPGRSQVEWLWNRPPMTEVLQAWGWI